MFFVAEFVSFFLENNLFLEQIAYSFKACLPISMVYFHSSKGSLFIADKNSSSICLKSLNQKPDFHSWFFFGSFFASFKIFINSVCSDENISFLFLYLATFIFSSASLKSIASLSLSGASFDSFQSFLLSS